MTTVLFFFLSPKSTIDRFLFNSVELVSLLIFCDVLFLEHIPGSDCGRQSLGSAFGTRFKSLTGIGECRGYATGIRPLAPPRRMHYFENRRLFSADQRETTQSRYDDTKGGQLFRMRLASTWKNAALTVEINQIPLH